VLTGSVEHEMPSAVELSAIRDIQNAAGTEHWPEDVAGPLRVLRFLRGRLGDKEAAQEMFKAMIRWRQQETRFNVEKLRSSVMGMSLEEFQHHFASMPQRPYLPAAFLGRSRTGNVVVWFKVGMWDIEGLMNEFGEHAMIKHEVQKMEYVFWLFAELSKREGRIPYLFVLLDLEAASGKLLHGKTRPKLLEMAKSLGMFYLDAVEVTLVINAPWAFRAAWALFTPMMTERQKSKMRVFGSIDNRADRDSLHATIAPEILPAALGGTAEPDLFGRKDNVCRQPVAKARRETIDEDGFLGIPLFSCCMSRPDRRGNCDSTLDEQAFVSPRRDETAKVQPEVLVPTSKSSSFSIWVLSMWTIMAALLATIFFDGHVCIRSQCLELPPLRFLV